MASIATKMLITTSLPATRTGRTPLYLPAINGQNHFKKIAGSKVLDEYYNTYPRK
jgi:hypothetical protein